MALGDRCGCGFFVSLGGCRHLDGLSSEGASTRVGDCLLPSPGDCEGSCTFLGEEPKGNSSGLLASLSYLTCG